MTKERRSEYVNTAIKAQSRVKAKDMETKILAPILKKIEAILATQDFKKLAKLRDALEAKIHR